MYIRANIFIHIHGIYLIKSNRKEHCNKLSCFAGIKDLGVYIKPADLVTTPADEVYLLITLTATRTLFSLFLISCLLGQR